MKLTITKLSDRKRSSELTDAELEYEIQNRLDQIDEALERHIDSERLPPISEHRVHSEFDV